MSDKTLSIEEVIEQYIEKTEGKELLWSVESNNVYQSKIESKIISKYHSSSKYAVLKDFIYFLRSSTHCDFKYGNLKGNYSLFVRVLFV